MLHLVNWDLFQAVDVCSYRGANWLRGCRCPGIRGMGSGAAEASARWCCWAGPAALVREAGRLNSGSCLIVNVQSAMLTTQEKHVRTA